MNVIFNWFKSINNKANEVIKFSELCAGKKHSRLVKKTIIERVVKNRLRMIYWAFKMKPNQVKQKILPVVLIFAARPKLIDWWNSANLCISFHLMTPFFLLAHTVFFHRPLNWWLEMVQRCFWSLLLFIHNSISWNEMGKNAVWLCKIPVFRWN